MKKKSSASPAFFNLRVLIGLFIITTGLSLALLAANPFGRGASAGAGGGQAPQTYNPAGRFIDVSALPPGFDCSQIQAFHIDTQENFRAGLIMKACGLMEGDSTPSGSTFSSSLFSRLVKSLLPELGGPDSDVILPDGSYPRTVQSESMEWGNGAGTWVVNYNDSRTNPSCYSGLSYSSDNGATWHAGQPLCSGHGTNFGDPIVVYNAHLAMWFAGDLVTGCGGQGIGLWTSTNGATWTTGACVHNGSFDDRESMWVDNNPASPHYGRMYVSWNDYNTSCGAGGCLFVNYSDNGTTWTHVGPLNSAVFHRNIQITGDLQGSGFVYLAAMDEGGGGLTTRTNIMYRSIDGGATWTHVNAGPSFQGPGRSTSGYFALVYSSIWRHMGWGEPAANGTVVSLDWAQCGQNVVCSGASDHGDVYYIRSTDAGLTWGTPVKLNTDSGTAMQWQPSLTATSTGALYASWYDGREVNGGADLNCPVGSPNNCYRRWGRVSLDNGATWQPDAMVGSSLTGLPAQPDSGIQPTYEGDYDYHSSVGQTAIGGWTDGRVVISGNAQQDVFVSFVVGASPTASPTPTPSATASPTPSATFTPTPTPIPCLVVNGGFETGSFPPWTISGDTSFTSVSTTLPPRGPTPEQTGPTTSDVFTDQIVPTVAGQAYDVTFWLDNADTTNNNRFGATFGSVTLVAEAPQPAFGYTQYTFTNVVPGANADLHFIFYNPPSYFYLDDVCVTPTGGGSPTPTATPSCTPIVINGSIANGDPSHTDKLAQSGIPQTCPATTSCAIFGDPNSFRYDSYTFNNTGGAACVTIDTNTVCNGDHAIFTSAYLGSFDPDNLCTNWAGDVGTDPNPDGSFQ